MSNTFAAGARLRAETMPYQKLWTISSTAASAAVTAETVVATGTSSTYKAGGAYMLQFHALLKGGTANTDAGLTVRDTNAAGSKRKELGYITLPSTARNYDGYWEHVVANTGGVDITARVLVLTLTGSGGTAQLNASTAQPYVFACYYIGLASDYPEAVAL